MKLCMDCQFFIVRTAVCGRAVATPDFVRGHPTSVSAQIERVSIHKEACGPQAKFFKIIPVAAVA